MSLSITRRSFLATTATATAGLGFPSILRAREDRPLRVAVIGLGGRSDFAFWNLKDESITAFCDPDTRTFSTDVEKRRIEGTPKELYPNARCFEDYRELFEHPDLFDAVWVSCCDHHHYHAALRGIRAGKAVYCEKPLAWSVHECQHLADEARKYQVATQMGNQGMGNKGWRVGRAYYESGVLGDIVEVHTYTGSQFGVPGHFGREAIVEEDPVPDGLNWDLYLGPAPSRPYEEEKYHPFEWRGYADFGNGGLGDWCCHLMNGFYKILEPEYPTTVECLGQEDPLEGAFPRGKTVRYDYPGRNGRAAFTAYWYDGAHTPPRPEALEVDRELGGVGSYLVGTKGTLWLKGGYVESPILIPETFRRSVPKPETLAPSRNHVGEWVQAAKGLIPYDAPLSHFGYAGPFTASALMGNIAARVDGPLAYDAGKGTFTNSEAANGLLKRANPREGWYV